MLRAWQGLLIFCPLVWTSVVCIQPLPAEITAPQVRDSLDRAIAYLRREQRRKGDWVELGDGRSKGGVSALCTLALLEAGVPPDDPGIRRALNHLRTIDNKKTYVVALQTMVFCRAGQTADRARIRSLVRWLESARRPPKATTAALGDILTDLAAITRIVSSPCWHCTRPNERVLRSSHEPGS